MLGLILKGLYPISIGTLNTVLVHHLSNLFSQNTGLDNYFGWQKTASMLFLAMLSGISGVMLIGNNDNIYKYFGVGQLLSTTGIIFFRSIVMWFYNTSDVMKMINIAIMMAYTIWLLTFCRDKGVFNF